MKYIRRGEEGVRVSDIGPSENQATTAKDVTFSVLTLLNSVYSFSEPSATWTDISETHSYWLSLDL